jgi:hypothetical protein
MTMPEYQSANTAEHLPRTWRADSSHLTTIVRGLVGYTIEEVERELILNSLSQYHGCRTYTANILGISIRCLRNKINQYAALGIAVPAPGQREDNFWPEIRGAVTPASDYTQSNPKEIGRLRCSKCGTSMLLTLIEPEKPDYDKRTFECTTCDHSEIMVVKYN